MLINTNAFVCPLHLPLSLIPHLLLYSATTLASYCKSSLTSGCY
nr:MAG TPA: hypothetical protein [Caudoviricetes sp.]